MKKVLRYETALMQSDHIEAETFGTLRFNGEHSVLGPHRFRQSAAPECEDPDTQENFGSSLFSNSGVGGVDYCFDKVYEESRKGGWRPLLAGDSRGRQTVLGRPHR